LVFCKVDNAKVDNVTAPRNRFYESHDQVTYNLATNVVGQNPTFRFGVAMKLMELQFAGVVDAAGVVDTTHCSKLRYEKKNGAQHDPSSH
jgi:hypothetical protein